METTQITKPTDEQVLRARARAYHNGIKMVARAQRHDGVAVLVTTSSKPNVYHLVTLYATHLECDCQAGQNGMYCMHRVVCHDYLLAERAEARRRAQAQANARSAAVTGALIPAGVLPSNKPFSIFK